MSLRIVFMGTPDFAVPTLIEIVGRGWDRLPGRASAADDVRGLLA